MADHINLRAIAVYTTTLASITTKLYGGALFCSIRRLRWDW